MFRIHYRESISSTCELLGVSRQVYYRAIRSKEKRQCIASDVIELVQSVRIEQPRIGTRKLYHILQESLRSLGVGRDRLFAILKANHMLIKPKRSYHITTNSHHRFRKHNNVIENLDVNRPEQVWVADITYVGNRANPMYLSLITDAYSKMIVGYYLSNTLAVDSSIKALKQAVKNRKYPKERLIHHSDRGLQYCSNQYQRILTKSHIKCSMTESYDPYQNAVAERINGILKQEFLMGTSKIDIKLMKKIVQQSIKVYNTKRPHLSCQMLTPEQMHKQNKVNIKTYKRKNTDKTAVLSVF
ncbi:IS3 family transposase [Kordia algicida OT-1]|uniref:Integrase, catalytic region n=1 Tax=Kordia algicida OT-1 TaxID=391587 RepID=A9DKX3_9FLAO|nr:IS3 family transposase [Kordia algicida]EDP94523.1 Integrase, catalytic region [Kordia algicida OT-1]EDP95087.1 Integrase, catalytic region [Kordia algicida OT-1]EDP95299.1 Integrase, catalytic region [Kordia algicida OT-1]EDP95392.1 Integrase, catalytic region [Kordia algicida OT-1]EDP95412.1 Integrase, catalytic region [Kordia algicida OT-1]